MADKFVSQRNLRFMIHEVMNSGDLTQHPYFEGHSREVFDLVLDTASKIAQNRLRPALKVMDQHPPELTDGRVRVLPVVRDFIRECGEGGWISATAPYELEGQQLPQVIKASFSFIFAAANYSASVYPMLTTGAAHLIESFGSEELKRTYIPNMFSGEWQGTMAMTEPQAGSSLSDIITRAEPTTDGYYRIWGQKIFISGGDHDGVDNVVNLMLAKIKGAPPGVKGISLFVVPRLRPDKNGGLEPNDVSIAGIFHKLGYRGCPITQLSMGESGDCRGWLVGEPHQGLAYMFQMMNEARIEVGIGAAGIASAAYYAALEYAKTRSQGRKPGTKAQSLPPVPIIQHADIKRMLLFQRAVVEGSLALLLQCALYSDYKRVKEGEDQEKCSMLLDLLTPVAKTYPSEMGILSCSNGLQVLGGYGYCDEFPLEQFYRDCRIHPIHEGTTGIHGLDLLGRKIVMKNGQAYQSYLEEVQKTIQSGGSNPVTEPYANRLYQAMHRLQDVTRHLLEISRNHGPELFLADSTLYLEVFGIIAIAWQWLVMGLIAAKALEKELPESEFSFYHGKLQTMKYFFHYELVKTEGLFQRLLEGDGLTVETNENHFID
ncbi:MAG: acyl-CoA dehydrogenase [Desulfomonile tiedjei]|uniref:Acyl-CoA dehydrogenase n=1 Tax=Desulfomonile tiedjei TaxID=2358 RepID=A0A9D6V7M3_9BACT|nr:acyl-CoA dehydrogenase [Desulfomonile tiedjei]